MLLMQGIIQNGLNDVRAPNDNSVDSVFADHHLKQAIEEYPHIEHAAHDERTRERERNALH